MRNSLFFVVLAALSARAADAPAKAAAVPEKVSVRAVAWDYSWSPVTEKEFNARVVLAVASAVKDGVDVIVFPEGFSKGRSLESALTDVQAAAGAERFVVLGNAPFMEGGKSVSRAYILNGGSWQVMDKLDPTPAERAAGVTPGNRLPLFRFRGAVVAALPAHSIQKPEIGAALKKRAVQLVLVSAPPQDEAATVRVARCAAARAAELGGAVVVATPSAEAPALYLPIQKGFDLKPAKPAGRDLSIPWKKLLDLRASPDASAEAPYLDPAPYFQTEI